MKCSLHILRFIGMAGLALGASTAVAQTAGTWSVDSLSEPRQVIPTAVVGDKVLFMGGDRYIGASTQVDIYNATTGTWTRDSLSPAFAAKFAAGAATGTTAFCAGGERPSSTGMGLADSKRVDVYHVATGTWTVDSLSEPRSSLSATSTGNKLLFGGGSPLALSNRVDIYDIATGTWKIDSLSQRRVMPTAVAVGPLVVFAGGILDFPNHSKRVDIYNTQTGTWTRDSLPVPMFQAAAAVVGTKVFFAGGFLQSAPVYSKRVDVYDAATGTWTVDSLSEARIGVAAVTLGTKVFFAGGNKFSLNIHSKRVDIYDAATGTWSIDSLSEGRSYMNAARVGDKILFAGGANGSPTHSKRVDIYTASPLSSRGPAVPAPCATLWPNPSRNGFTLLLDAPATVRVLNATGRVVGEDQAVPAGMHVPLRADLTPGVYFVVVRQANGAVQTVRAVQL